MPTTPHSNDPRDNLGDYVLGKDGKPMVDRYGRPIRKRPAASGSTVYEPRRAPQYPPRQPEQRRQPPRQETRVVRERPRQQPPRPAQRPAPRPAPNPVPQPQEPPMQIHRRREKTKRRKAKAPGCGTIIAIILVLALAGLLLSDARLHRVAALPDQQIANTAGTNWLLVGSDSREGLSEKDVERLGTGGDIGSTRTDTIMLMHIPLAGKATLMSIPRDSYVELPGYGYDKINAAFAIGGQELLVQTVEHNTGLHVDRYAEIGMGGLAGVVDAVGGVEICVAEPIDDPLANINLQPGCQKMDGATALGYVRTRATAQGDLDRVARQREFMSALVSRALSPAVWLNPFRVVKLLWVGPSLFIVGQGDHIWNLARIPIAMSTGLETETVPIGGFADTEVGNVVLWDDVAAEELFASLR